MDFDILTHVLVPEHRLVAVGDYPRVLEEMNVEDTYQLPRILVTDAVIKRLNREREEQDLPLIVPGDVIEIQRPRLMHVVDNATQEEVGTYTVYRVVVQ